jgi:hypothetical protein
MIDMSGPFRRWRLRSLAAFQKPSQYYAPTLQRGLRNLVAANGFPVSACS